MQNNGGNMNIQSVLKDVKYQGTVKDFDTDFVTDDSRKVRAGCVFVCSKGLTFDGHTFAAKALEIGAKLVVCERDMGLEDQIIVENSRQTYSLMCANLFGNPSRKMKMIGITGTNGKTTSAFLIKDLLEQQGKKVGLMGTVQNMIDQQIIPAKFTTPQPYELQALLALMYKSGCEYVVMEVSSQALVQNRLYGITYDVAVFTNLTQDHLDYHITLENYLQAKLKLFKMAKKAVVNIDDEYAERVIQACSGEVITYSAQKNEADFTAKEIKFLPTRVCYELVTNCNIGRVKVSTPGIFSVYNSMCAGIAGIAVGIDFKDVVASLSEVSTVKGRVELVECDEEFTPVIDYAHTPDALENVLKTLREIAPDHELICLFGCGGDRDRTKRPEMARIAEKMADRIIVTSDNSRTEKTTDIMADIKAGLELSGRAKSLFIEDREQAIRTAIMIAGQGATILLAGKGHETYQIIGKEKHHFDEKEIVNGIFAEMSI